MAAELPPDAEEVVTEAVVELLEVLEVEVLEVEVLPVAPVDIELAEDCVEEMPE